MRRSFCMHEKEEPRYEFDTSGVSEVRVIGM